MKLDWRRLFCSLGEFTHTVCALAVWCLMYKQGGTFSFIALFLLPVIVLGSNYHILKMYKKLKESDRSPEEE